MKQFELNRKKYRVLKTMDHQQMQDFMNTVQNAGYRLGVVESMFDGEKFLNKLKEEKGIGPKKIERIRELLKECGAKTNE